MSVCCVCAFDAFCAVQLPIKAGHEFIISVDPQYASICDDKVLYMDYVSGDNMSARVLCISANVCC